MILQKVIICRILMMLLVGLMLCPISLAQTQRAKVDANLIQALLEDNVQPVQIYLKRRGNPNAKDSSGVTLLTLASNNGSLACMKLLLDRGAKVNLPGTDGETPLIRATGSLYRAGIVSVRLLVARGANVNQAMPKGTTPLMKACSPVASRYEDEYVEAVRLFIRKGARVNARNQMGATPLKLAQESGSQKIIAILRQAGAKR